MRSRLVRVLALPIIAAFFLIGWVLYCVGGKKETPGFASAKKSKTLEKQFVLPSDEGIETGLIGEMIATQ
jgi:hypothetical protein